MTYLAISIKLLLFAIALTPLIMSWETLFPYILGKMVFSRVVIEVALILFVAYLACGGKAALGKEELKKLIRMPLVWFIGAFFISMAVSTVVSENSYRAFWGDAERGEGLFGMLHVLLFGVMAWWMFSKTDWMRFFKLSLGVGCIVGFYALLQFFGVERFPFTFVPEPRPGSFLGNPAILAGYMFFILIFASMVGLSHIRRNSSTEQGIDIFWKYGSLITGALALASIFLSGTRGAVLGLAAGMVVLLALLAFYKQTITVSWWQGIKTINLRVIAVSLLLVIVVSGSLFWTTRENTFWQNIPGFDRLAQTTLEDSSTKMRLLGWGVSGEAFLERPLLGWGPENYIVAYEKHYNPDMSAVGETWLDRAHNKLLDVAVMQGSVGLIAYLGIFIALALLLLRLMKRDTTEQHHSNFFQHAIIAAGVTAYVVQNLVLFDSTMTYLFLFALMGYVITQVIRFQEDKGGAYQVREGFSLKIPRHFAYGVIGLVVAGGFFVIYAYNAVPYAQALAFREAAKGGRHVDDLLPILDKALDPYTFIQLNLRSQGVDAWFLDSFFYNDDLIYDPGLQVLAEKFLKAEEELVQKEPYDVRTLIRLTEMINPLAERNVELYKETEKLMRMAVARAPNRQEVYYHLAFSLAGQERFEESIETARYALSLSPNVARAHYHLALMLMVAGQYEEAEHEMLIAEELKPDLGTLLPGDRNNVIIIYNTVGRPDKSAELILKSIHGPIGKHAFDRKYYEDVLRYFAVRHEREGFLAVANYLKEFDDLKEDMEVLIDLVENERWDIIDRLE